MSVISSTFTSNSATYVSIPPTAVVLEAQVLMRAQGGGAIAINSGAVSVLSCIFTSNSASDFVDVGVSTNPCPQLK